MLYATSLQLIQQFDEMDSFSKNHVTKINSRQSE